MREERLRATAGLRSAQTLSSWRGLSGRRYIVAVHPLDEQDLLDVIDAVILAVRRDETGTGHVIDLAMAGSQLRPEARSRWLEKVKALGASEMHVHRLADTEDQRRAILEDLRESESYAS